MKNLVIVESPTKSKTLAKFLGSDYQITASMGHIRDLPKSEIGVDTENNFEPRYIIPKLKQKQVTELKKMAKGAQTIWLATDPDREGEAIAFHLAEILKDGAKKDKSVLKRVTFHEITEGAILDAFKHPREIDFPLVNAQQARRVLDRLVGYKLSPLLWKKVKSGLSAGRVQSVAVRLVVEREREVLAFKPVEYWSIAAELYSSHPELVSGSEIPKQVRNDNQIFKANLIELDGKKLEIGNQEQVDKHVTALRGASYKVESVNKKETKRNPASPFTTSTLQQTASNRLGMSAKKTMSTAQQLYERGLITYMRTDSPSLSTAAIESARSYIADKIGKSYLPQSARVFKTKSKVAQEAHEAIRPTDFRVQGTALREQDGLTKDHIRLYELIWKRTLASQMNEAIIEQTAINVTVSSRHPEAKAEGSYLLRANGSVIRFDGWMKLYAEPETDEEEDEKEQLLPEVTAGEQLKLEELLPEQHFTEPPPRFNEASLIKKLEELGIGRPSTYAPTISTIQDRFYVEKKEKRFYPTSIGMAVNDFLMQNFPEIIDYSFTARMEDQLDEVANGKMQWQPMLRDFYTPFEKKLGEKADVERVKIETEEVDKSCPKCAKPLLVRYGRFGKFLACSGFPECKHTEALDEPLNLICPKDGGEVVQRRTKKGRVFYGCKNYPNCDFATWTKPLAGGSEQGTGNS